MEHRIIRSKSRHLLQEIKIEMQDVDVVDSRGVLGSTSQVIKTEPGVKASGHGTLLPEHHHIPRPPRKLQCQFTSLPSFLYGLGPKVQCNGRVL